MKKTVSLLICSVFLLSLFSTAASAIPLSFGTVRLNSQFGNGELAGALDYVYFSPVRDAADNTKYPLLVWLHGRQGAPMKRGQLNNYEFSNWASDEYQARFASTGGCFLICPRSNDVVDNTWSAILCDEVYDTVNYFISLNSANIDTDRIYIAGVSSGGSMVWYMLNAYPDFFAAAFPLAAIIQPSASTLAKLSDVSVWMFSGDNDYYQSARTSSVKVNYDYLRQSRPNPSTVRLTTFTEAVFADGSKKKDGNGVALQAEHYIWESFTYDMHMADGVTVYKYSTTVDGSGNQVTFPDGEGIITWLDAQTRAEDVAPAKLSFFERIASFFRSIITFFRSIFGIN